MCLILAILSGFSLSAGYGEEYEKLKKKSKYSIPDGYKVIDGQVEVTPTPGTPYYKIRITSKMGVVMDVIIKVFISEEMQMNTFTLDGPGKFVDLDYRYKDGQNIAYSVYYKLRK